MNTHDFYNILDGRRKGIARLENGVWDYPDEFIERYNAAADNLMAMVVHVIDAINNMDALEKEQFKHTSGNK